MLGVSLGASEYLSELNFNGLITRFGFQYADENRELLNEYKDSMSFIEGFKVSDEILEQFISFAESNDVPRNNEELKTSKNVIKDRLKAYIARNIWKNDAFYSVLLEDDKVFHATMDFISQQ